MRTYVHACGMIVYPVYNINRSACTFVPVRATLEIFLMQVLRWCLPRCSSPFTTTPAFPRRSAVVRIELQARFYRVANSLGVQSITFCSRSKLILHRNTQAFRMSVLRTKTGCISTHTEIYKLNTGTITFSIAKYCQLWQLGPSIFAQNV